MLDVCQQIIVILNEKIENHTPGCYSRLFGGGSYMAKLRGFIDKLQHEMSDKELADLIQTSTWEAYNHYQGRSSRCALQEAFLKATGYTDNYRDAFYNQNVKLLRNVYDQQINALPMSTHTRLLYQAAQPFETFVTIEAKRAYYLWQLKRLREQQPQPRPGALRTARAAA